MTICVGLDLSLTRTGAAWTEAGDLMWATFKPEKPRGRPAMDRAAEIAEAIGVMLDVVDPAFAAVESPSFGSRHSQAHKIGMQRGLSLAELRKRGIPWVDVAPKKRFIIATGSGNPKVEGAEKAEMLAAVRGFGHEVTNHDEADAVAILCVGLELAMVPHPFGILDPGRHRAINGLTLPHGAVERIKSRSKQPS